MFSAERRGGHQESRTANNARRLGRGPVEYGQLFADQQLKIELAAIHRWINLYQQVISGAGYFDISTLPTQLRRAFRQEFRLSTEAKTDVSAQNATAFATFVAAGRQQLEQQLRQAWQDPYVLRCGIEVSSAQEFLGVIAIMAEYERYRIDSNTPQVFPDNPLLSWTAVRIEFKSAVDLPCKVVFTRSLAPRTRKQLEYEEEKYIFIQRHAADQGNNEKLAADLPALAERLLAALQKEHITIATLEQAMSVLNPMEYAQLLEAMQFQEHNGILYPYIASDEVGMLLSAIVSEPGQEVRMHGWFISRSPKGFLLRYDAGIEPTAAAVQKILTHGYINLR